MIRKYDLPDQLVLPCGAVLKPVIGGHLEQRPFLTQVDVTKNGWGNDLIATGRSEQRLIIEEAKRKGLKYRRVSVLSRRLRGKLDYHGHAYTGSQWVFVEVRKEAAQA